MQFEIQNIQKRFGRKQVLNGVSLAADPGTCVGIVGKNGSGKSTLLSILAGILKPDGGKVTWGGDDLLSSPKKLADTIGYVPQGTPLFDELTALDNLRLWYAGKSRDLAQDLKDGVPAMLDIPSFLHVPVRQMSGGMKKRLSISCAMAHRPPVLLLDEPSAALDLSAKAAIHAYFREFTRQGGILLLSTHDAPEFELCDKLYLLKDGALTPYAYDGDLSSLVARM